MTSSGKVRADETVDLEQEQQQITSFVNLQRVFNHENSLRLDPSLNAVAQAFAYDMYVRKYFDHTSPEGKKLRNRLKEGNINSGWAGENIAKGQKDSAEVMTGWMNSPHHRDNILGAHYTRIGVGHYGDVWVQEFTDDGLR